MTAVGLVVVALIVIGSMIALVLVVIIANGLIEAHRDRLEPSLGDVRAAIIRAVSGEEAAANDIVGRARGFSKRYIVDVMLDIAPSVNGTSKAILVSLGEEIGVVRRARKGVRSRRWSTRLYSARVLTAFGVDSEDRYLLFSDKSAEVRAQAAAWAVACTSPRAIELLVVLLNDDDGLCGFAAQDAFIRIGFRGTDALMHALTTTADELMVRRILEIAVATGDERFYPQALALSADPSPATRALAAAVLACAGNPNAGGDLVALLDDPSDDVVLAAAAGLQKLSYWPGAASVEPLLDHEWWELRKQAGLTLLALGAPGEILLRVNTPGDGLAAEMAVQALELRSVTAGREAA
jgi:HEAT repeat protein